MYVFSAVYVSVSSFSYEEDIYVLQRTVLLPKMNQLQFQMELQKENIAANDLFAKVC